MATRTSYLNLIKPDYTDAADIADINANMDTLDNTIQGLDETGSKSLTAHNNATDAHSAMQATVDDTLVPTADLNTIRNLLSNLGNRIKAATGASGWKGDPATTLAAMATLASNLSSGSDVTWSGTKFTNTKLGISGVTDINGYVSFGPNFGGLIIQWGYYSKIIENFNPGIISNATLYTNYVQISYPVAITKPLACYSSIGGGDYQNQNFVGAETSTANLISENPLTAFSLSVSGRLNDIVGVHWAMIGLA